MVSFVFMILTLPSTGQVTDTLKINSIKEALTLNENPKGFVGKKLLYLAK